MSQQIAKVFRSGNSQAVRLPREFRITAEQVYIRREGDSIILTPRPANWDGFMEDCEPLSDDFSVEGAALPDDVERRSL